MSYVEQTWQTGDTVTAEKLNHMEAGIAEAGGGGRLIVTLTDDGTELIGDKTWQECYNVFSAGQPVIVVFPLEYDSAICSALAVWKYPQPDPDEDQCGMDLHANYPSLTAATPSAYVHWVHYN